MEEVLSEIIKCFNNDHQQESMNPFMAAILKNIEKIEAKSSPLSESSLRQSSPSSSSIPASVYELDDSLEIYFEIPNVTKTDIDISISSDNVLNVSANKTVLQLPSGSICHQNEIQVGSLKRSIKLPKSVRRNSVRAKFENGLLVVKLMKPPNDVNNTKIVIE